MGSLAARDMAAHTDLKTAVRWHLLHNHYPPVPESLVPACVRAIRRIRNGTDHKRVRLPRGVRHKTGATAVSPHTLAESFHLYDFV